MAISFRRILAIIGTASLVPVIAGAQESATISGHATGEGGIALAGGAVSIPELGLGGITRDDGSYVIAVPSARVNRQAVTVTARRVGYKPKSARVTINPGTVTQNFVLEANPLQLGEVVVTGAGTSTEVEKLGNVRNSVAPELIVKANESNIVQALAGKAPNVQISQSAGDPGADSKITIRGLRTINGDVDATTNVYINAYADVADGGNLMVDGTIDAGGFADLNASASDASGGNLTVTGGISANSYVRRQQRRQHHGQRHDRRERQRCDQRLRQQRRQRHARWRRARLDRDHHGRRQRSVLQHLGADRVGLERQRRHHRERRHRHRDRHGRPHDQRQ